MSASLVGSEMCIRDRQRPTKRNASLALLLRSTAPSCRQRLSLRMRPWRPCLLYTSDAADDM
eukprot:10599477-Alexandrium_andersonii.AAC.1